MVDNTDDPLYNQLDPLWKEYIVQVSDTTVENMVNQLYKDESRIKHLEAEIERLKTKCDAQALILKRLNPERSPGVLFIAGEQGEKDKNGMPEVLLVCPAYGVDFSYSYKRTNKVSGPEW
jgi:hypothetical protein